jgi:peptidase E
MELNEPISREPITLNGKQCFCAEGTRLALDYLQTARNALKKSDVATNELAIKSAVTESLEKFLSHCHHGAGCKTCK